jgi:hypothetical protein
MNKTINTNKFTLLSQLYYKINISLKIHLKKYLSYNI